MKAVLLRPVKRYSRFSTHTTAGMQDVQGKKTLTLRALGLDKNQSSRWQAIARIPEEEFERHIVDVSDL